MSKGVCCGTNELSHSNVAVAGWAQHVTHIHHLRTSCVGEYTTSDPTHRQSHTNQNIDEWIYFIFPMGLFGSLLCKPELFIKTEATVGALVRRLLLRTEHQQQYIYKMQKKLISYTWFYVNLGDSDCIILSFYEAQYMTRRSNCNSHRNHRRHYVHLYH